MLLSLHVAALTVDPSTGCIAGFLAEKTVSISEATRVDEFFAFVINRVIVVS